jgi:hypothetical protein
MWLCIREAEKLRMPEIRDSHAIVGIMIAFIAALMVIGGLT